MRFLIHADHAARETDYRNGRYPIALLLTDDEVRRLRMEAAYNASHCPILRELLANWDEFEAELMYQRGQGSAPSTQNSGLPLVRTGQGAFTRDYPREQLAGDRVESVAELGGQLNVTA